MAHIESHKHAPAQQPRLIPSAALTLLSLSVPGLALADATLPTVKVTGQTEATYKAETVSSPKFTQPLVDTPQTVTVIKKEILQEQGVASLSEALRNTPGVTLQLGEGGRTSLGDSIFMRGSDTQGAILVDGVRDLGAVTRDTFNTEQVEVIKGPAGADIGRGAGAGYVNMATKLPLADNFTGGALSLASGDKKRLTVDINRQLDLGIAGTALRLNLMKEDGGVPGRDKVSNESFGFAPSIAFGLGTPTRTYFYYQHIEQHNRPDGGVPTIGLDGFYDAEFDVGGAQAGVSPAEVDSDNFYGDKDDYQHVYADMLTARIEHDLGERTTISNLTRWGRLKSSSALNAPNTLDVTAADPANWTVQLRRQDDFDENTILTNQTNLRSSFVTGSVSHDLTAGIELIREKINTRDFTADTVDGNLYNPDPNAAFPALEFAGRAKGQIDTVAAYAFDTIGLTERWDLTAGLRLERYDAEYSFDPADPTDPTDAFDKSGTLTSWKLGLLYKPAANGSIYVAYANAEKPPGSDDFQLRANTANSSGNVNINSAELDPQEATNIELGTKWELMDRRLALTAALYRSDTKNLLARTDPLDPTSVVQVGKQRVQGVELGVVGQLTRRWQISAGLTTMDAKLLEGNGTSESRDDGAGVRWTPKVAATLWTTYQLPHNITIGGGGRYVGTQRRDVSPNSNADTTNMPEIPDYWVFDAMASYRVNKNLNLQLNVYNLFDKEYIATLNNNGRRYTPGTPLSAQLTASLMF
ncbi:catecholate siderophore receptor Fiu [Denitromonas iodatirespirans]|uniref:Catecholate siderophore receptor Fiu n=1 Tax=Denitromonas iodatirespirans TaxID=2795389 RepID=A0A944DGV3_DENI1|nr:catecholate siderophore receptor Fiu [Denitromonas iodatirespirans]MBT0962613.1 catecholate siderophore receptor Fiu [Denitromonas iodatirespirans]